MLADAASPPGRDDLREMAWQTAPAEPRAARVRPVAIPADSTSLPGSLALPAGAVGVVVFAHGSGSSRFSPRNVQVAASLNDARLGTLLLDLLSEQEARVHGKVFDVPLLAERLSAATAWVEAAPEVCHLPIGYFGASTGAAAALWAAAQDGGVGAVVCRGGRPDLAAARLPAVRAPTLLVVGGNDDVVLELNREALALLGCEAELRVVEGATHLFEEPGALEEVASLARRWFLRHLGEGPPSADGSS